MSTNFEVGVYSAAEKIIKAVQSLTAPLSQAIYPNMSLKFSRLKSNEAVSKLFKLSRFYLIPLFCIIVLLILFESYFEQFLAITSDRFSSVFFVLLPAIAVGSLNYLLGIVGLVNLNKEKWFQRATITRGVLNLILCWFLSENYGAMGSVVALLVAESTVFLLVGNHLVKIKKIRD